MSRTDILNEIKKAEATAKVKVEQAEADKKTAIADARRESGRRIQDAEAKARENYDSSVAKEMETLATEREKLISKGKKEAEELDVGIDAKLEKVNDFLRKEFARTINAAS